MKPSCEAGFTLTEMLVALLVLGATAGAMSTTIGTSFNSYERLSEVADGLQSQRKLKSVFTRVSNQYWLPDGQEQRIVIDEIVLRNAYFQSLKIEQLDDMWEMSANAEGFESVRVFSSQMPLRMMAEADEKTFINARNDLFDYQWLKLQENRGEWTDLIVVPLKVDADPDCRFDIVGRRCR